MQLQELDRDQRVALVALLECFALSDNTISEGEAAEIRLVAETYGDASYRELLDEVESRFEGETELQAFLRDQITDPTARELIFGLVLDLSMSSPVVHPRIDLLDWLRETWAIQVNET
jgi:hypothetical protein